MGLLILANTFFSAALFSPLTPTVVIVITLILMIPAILSQINSKWFKEFVNNFSAGPIFAVTALTLGASAYCSQVIVWYDTRLYHMQVIKWLSEYGLVPGLGLIHSRFGYPSSWFTLTASVNHGLLQGRTGSFTGGICLLLLAVHFLIALLRIITGRGKSPDLFIAMASFLTLIIIMVYGIPNSPAPDLPVIILVIETAWSIVIISEFQPDRHHRFDTALNARLIPLLLAAGTVSIKLSALPLLAVAGCYYLFKGRFKSGKLLVAGSVLTFFLAPLAAAGYITTGCAFYPSSTFCVNVPWSLGAAQANAESALIREWARWGGRPTPDGATAWNWVVPWFAEEKVCSLFLVMSVLSVLVIIIRHAGEKHIYWNSSVAALAISGIALMLYAAPNWRFGLGYLVILPALTAENLLPWLTRQTWKQQGVISSAKWAWLGGITALVIATHIYVVPRPTFKPLGEVADITSMAGNDNPHFNLIRPPRIWNVQFALDEASGKKTASVDAPVSIDRVGDFTYYRPANMDDSELCTVAPVPCAPGRLNGLRLRDSGKGIAGGFVKAVTNNISQEKFP
ncbi:MAG: hypothetical protein PHC49_15030 [Desulfuromonadaceae bacterium]|nr:hypothetical protein [Desulfuromonadaceae bacterium]